jgi:nicotinate-nucleotide adenylyltransferase
VEFDSWKDWREICNLAGIAALNRQGFDTDPAELDNQLQGIDIHWVRMPLIGVSATQIRRDRAAGASIRYLVTPAVEEYIEKNGLYV